EYIENYYPIAVEEMQRTGIPASIKLAQGILESNAGRSYLAREANNHFGIKCGSDWDGKKKFREDDDYDHKGRLQKSCFRAYASAELSFYAHSQFLKDPRKAYRYGFLFDLQSDDYKSWAKGLQRSGYATNPKYSSLLMTLIEQYELYQYDTPIYTRVNPSSDIASFTYKINGADVLEALQGDTPSDVADRMKTSVDKIIRYNEKLHHPAQPLKKGYVVFLQRKRNKYHGKKQMHVVRIGETVFDISQQYGVREQKLRKRNEMANETEPLAGEYIYLQGRRPKDDVIKLRSLVPEKKNDKNHIPTRDSEEDSSHKIPDYAGAQGEFLDFTISPADSGLRTKDGSSSNHEMAKKIEHGTPPSSRNQSHMTSSVQLAPRTEPQVQVEEHKKYQVRKGDTLYRISRVHDMTVEELIALNGLKGNVIHESQWLVVR
ncbi:MAG TPA: glucosaminidase domain-containing protein, partial [Saprospiraceae bacterium]|nr:glucosaminidase domain-containing protein [Saprospiraceae bacterium]